MERLKKYHTIPFLNMESVDSPTWARIGKSTTFDLSVNAQTEENDFIESEMKETDVASYKPELPQELQTNKGDEAFDYIYEKFYNLPTGEGVREDLLIVFAGNIGTEEAPKFNAWRTNSTLILEHLDTVAEKIYFKLAINKIERGTVTITDKKPVFTAN